MFKKLFKVLCLCLFLGTVFGIICYQNNNGENPIESSNCNFCGYYDFLDLTTNDTGLFRYCLQYPYIPFNESLQYNSFNFTQMNECDIIEDDCAVKNFGLCDRDKCNINCEAALPVSTEPSISTTSNSSHMMKFSILDFIVIAVTTIFDYSCILNYFKR